MSTTDDLMGTTMVHIPTGGLAKITVRNTEDNGWWIVGGGGLADSVIESGDWVPLGIVVAHYRATAAAREARVIVTVTCPYCGHAEDVRATVKPSVQFSWSASVLFLTATFGGASGIEHHCEALKRARSMPPGGPSRDERRTGP